MKDEVKYGLDDNPQFTDRLTPPWWSETRRQELSDYFDEHNLFDAHLAKLECPMTVEAREPCHPVSPWWFVRKVHDGFRLERPGDTAHITLRDKGPEDELSARLAKWAEEEMPLTVEISHGP